MQTKLWQRCLSMLLVVLMVVTMVPTSVFAAEDEHVHDHSESSSVVETIDPATEEQPDASTQEPPVQEEPAQNAPSGEPVQETTVEETTVEETPAEDPVTETPAAEFSDAYKAVQAEIDKVVEYYPVYYGLELPTGELSEEERAELYAAIEDIVLNKMDANERENALMAIREVEYMITDDPGLTEEECEQIAASNPVFVDFAGVVSSYASDVSLLEDLAGIKYANIGLSYSGSDHVWSASDTSINGQVGGRWSNNSTTLTIKNNYPYVVALSFAYTYTIEDLGSGFLNAKGAVTVAGKAQSAVASGTGVYGPTELSPGATITVKLESGTNSSKALYTKINITDFLVTGTVTFAAATEGGSYTVTGGTLSGAAAPTTDTSACGTTYTLTATPAEGYKFVGWYCGTDVDNALSSAISSTKIEDSFPNSGTCTIVPKFTQSVTTVTFNAPSGDGSYTVNDNEVAAGTQMTEASYALEATPATDADKFVHWYDGVSGTVLSTDAVFDFVPDADTEAYTVYPVFEDLATYTITVTANGGSVNGTRYPTGVAGKETSLTATANAGYTFLGWIDTNGKILVTANTYTFTPSANTTLTAVFASKDTAAWFKVDNTHLFNDLNAAAAAGTKIVLAADGILPAGDYTIPSGDTLLIPYNANHTSSTTKPETDINTTNYVYGGTPIPQTTPYPYRTLEMAEGANITVNGAINVNARMYAGGTGSVVGGVNGPYGHIKMNTGSTITVNSGANLYCWGYITGSGSVVVENGGTAYENFQIMDWRGGTCLTGMVGDEKVFPMSQYYVQNIEVPVILKAGASETGYTASTITLVGAAGTEVPFIGPAGMFNITEGYVVKDYNEETDRLEIDVHGTLTMKPLKLSMKLSAGGNTTIDSAAFELPINGNISVHVYSGSLSITQDVILLPGAKIIIEDGTNCVLQKGVKFYLFDLTQWTDPNSSTPVWEAGRGGYVGTGVGHLVQPLNFAPGRPNPTVSCRSAATLTDAEIVVNGTVDLSAGSIWTTGIMDENGNPTGGANIRSEGKGKLFINADVEVPEFLQAIPTGDAKQVNYYQVPVTHALLRNGDESYTATAGNGNGIYQYSVTYDFNGDGVIDNKDGRWHYVVNDGTSEKGCDGVPAVVENHANNKAPTCTESGNNHYACFCGLIEYDEEVPATNHVGTTVTEPAVAPTCIDVGYTEHKYCTACNEEFVKREEVPARGHDYSKDPKDIIVLNAASCLRDGDGYYKCLNDVDCNVVQEVTIPALGHNWVLAENPYTWVGYTTCSAKLVCANNCGLTTTPLYGEISKNVTATPTCQQTGTCVYTATFVLPHNPDVTTDDEVVTDTVTETLSKEPHNLTHHAAVAPTCAKDGNVEYWACDACGKNYSESTPTTDKVLENVVLETIDHNMAHTAKKDATCLEAGNHEYWYCDMCDTYYKDAEGKAAYSETDPHVIGKKSHTMTVQAETESTCDVAGFKAYWLCADCGIYYKDADGAEYYTNDDGTPATSVTVVTKDLRKHVTATKTIGATCTEKGYTLTECTYDDCTYAVMSNETEPKGHRFEGQWDTETDPATCLENGTAYRYCGRGCGEVETKTIDATGHTLTKVDAQAVTCEKNGQLEHWHCSACNNNYSENNAFAANAIEVVITAQGHTYGSVVVTPPTCKAGGFTTYTCTNTWCDVAGGHSYTGDGTASVDHAYEGEWIVRTPASCTVEGEEYRVCIYDCGTEEKQSIDKITHSMKHVEAKAATCFAAGNHAYWYCDSCKVYYKDAAGDAAYSETDPYVIPQRAHDFGDWYESKKDTCTEAGEMTRICKYEDCQHPETKVVDEIKDHDYEAVVTAPTCTTGGYTTYTCKIDPAHTYTDNPVEPLNHKDPVTGVSTLETVTHEATCTENGYTFTTCKQCDYELKTTTEVAVGHTLTFTAAVEPTCLAEGNEAYWTCSVCGKHFQGANEEAVKFAPDSAAVAAADLVLCKVDHQMEHADAKEVTCTVDGNHEYWYCSACKIYYQDADGETAFAKDAHVIKAEGHKLSKTAAVAATCIAAGNNDYWTCSVCDKVYADGDKFTTNETSVEDQTLPKLDHAMTTVAAKDATCTETGNLAYSLCSSCEIYYKDANGETPYLDADNNPAKSESVVIVSAKGHREVLTAHEAVEAECEKDGNIAYWTCEDCGTYFTDAEGENVTTAEAVVLSKLGHTHLDDNLENDILHTEKAATCEEDGVQYRYCGNGCGLYVEETIAKLGHEYELTDSKDAACGVAGYETYVCKNDSNHTYTNEIPALEHEWEETRVITAPSCAEQKDGVSWFYCNKCDDMQKLTVTWAHNWVASERVEATCTEDGHESGRVCSGCGKTDSTTVVIPALGHTFADDDTANDGEWVIETEETCTANGEKRLYCTRCTDKTAYKSEVIDEIDGHEYTTDVTEPTCTEGGYTTYTCIRNDHTYTADEVPARGHSYERDPEQEWIVDKDPTCLTAGSKHRDCTECDAVDTKEIPATDHSYDNGAVTEPTCTEEGYTTYTCQNSWCDTVDGHTKVENKVPALKHTYEDPNTTDIWVNVTPDTCTTIGVDRRDCGRCDAFETREFNDIAGHSMTHVEAKDATCTETGNYEYWYCDTCKTFFKNEEGGEAFEGDSYVVAIIPHVWATVQPETSSDCYTAGYYAYWLCDNCDIFYKDAEGTPYTNADGTPATDIRVVTKALRKHDYKVDIIAPTCTEKGYNLTTCQYDDCPYEAKAREVEALGHTYEDSDSTNDGQWTTEKPATCLEAGEARLKCTRPNCAAYDSKVLEATGHTLTHHVAVAPDCTTDGTIEYWSCSVCEKNYGTDNKYDAVVLTTVVDPAKGHTMDEGVEAVEATCLTDGNYAYWYCSACETYFKDAEGKDAYSDTDPYVIPAAGHDLTHHAAVASTCTEDGNIEYWSCSVCEKNFGENNVKAETALDSVLDAKDGHSMTHVTAVAATCFAAGNTEHWYCETCDKYFEDANGDVATTLEEVTIAQREHDFGDWYETREDTCTTAGEERRDCGYTDCEHFETKVVDEIKSHNYEAVVTPPTCTEEGYTTHTCSHCLDSYKDTYVSELNHTDPETGLYMLSVVTYPATCTEKGYTHTTCPLCGLDEVTYEEPATGHALTFTAAVEPTCLAEGNEAYWTCSVCKKHFQGESEEAVKYAPETEAVEKSALTLAKVSHEMTHVAAAEAGCLTDGNHEYWYCSACKIYYQDAEGENAFAKNAHVIPAVGHDLTHHEAVASDCTNAGTIEYWSCSVCGKNFGENNVKAEAALDSVVDPADGHSMTHVAADPGDCTTNGNHEYWYCSVCKIYFKDADGDEAYEANAHIITAPGHTEAPLAAVPPTCTEKGLTEGVECSVCHAILVPQRNVKENGHSKTIDQAVAPSCTEPGLTEGAHCSVCDEVLIPQEPIPANGHDGELITGVPAKCELDGWKDYYQCKTCHEYFQDEACEELIADLDAWKTGDGKIEMLEHDWGTGRVTTEPECEKDGVRTFTCSLCYAPKEEDEPALGHAVVHHEAKKPTYTSSGWEAYETCSRCDEYNTMVPIPALGEPEIKNFDEFLENLAILEGMADTYVKTVSPGKDPLMLIVKYIRTGVDRYNSGSWNIMAGYEDADFAKYIAEQEAAYNLALADGEELMKVTGMKNLNEFALPNGDWADIGHVFGSMDITYTNKSSVDHADVSGWAGDTVDLMSMVDQFGWTSTDLESMIEEINTKYFLKYREDFEVEPIEGTFSNTDMEGDLDAFYVMQQIYDGEYENGSLTSIFKNYMTPALTSKDRAAYFMNNRLGGVTLRTDVRDAVYNTYIANGVVATLEGTRPFATQDITQLRKACCYVVADYLCRLAGDFIDIKDNPIYTVFQSTTSVLAPGITQKINYATTARDNKTMVYYLATGDVTRGDVHVFANYNNNDPAAGWAMSRVIDQANVAQAKYGDPESDLYIKDYNVIASINGAGYDMHTGEPSGILVMNGTVYHPIDAHGFFGILDDGTAMIGTMEQYNALQAERPGRVQEAIATFGDLIKNGEIVATAEGERASRTAVGITATGKVVFMVLDGRQGDLSCGGDMVEIAQIMLEAGCVTAVNLDGGGSSTYVAKEPGSSELSVVSKPSDGISRSVSTSLMMVSTAPSSTAFDHAVVDGTHTYFTVGASGAFEASAVSATGNAVEMPEGTVWAVKDPAVGTITEDGVFTAAANGSTEIQLLLNDVVVGSKKIHVVTPDNVYFEKKAMNAIFGQELVLPVRAVYEGKAVAITEADVTLSLSTAAAGVINGFVFVGDEACGLKKVKVTAALAANPGITASMDLALYTQDEASFDFENATGGDYQLAWDREVSNATEDSANIYRAIDLNEDMVTEYSFAIDMSKIDMPEQLEDLTYMLPGADMADASAWNFLLQLAERVSVLTEVTPTLYFDKNLELDYSEMSIANEYFDLKDTVYNEEENSLKLVMKWRRQETPIDAATANPMCILSGIKLTPKDGAEWNNNNALAIVNKGIVSYDIYLRANALYSFSSKPENQEIYGLYPFQNVRDDGVQENGGHFESIYKNFEDSYTLINGVKDGWVVEGGGFAYYEDGEKYTGICEVDGYYYDFGENGINAGQKKYSGYMTDAAGEVYYLYEGVKQTGWKIWDMDDVEYFNPETGAREELTADETLSTCIVDGQCIYTSESGAEKTIKYDDAAGHEYVLQPDGSYVCSVCGWKRVEMSQATVKLPNTIYTYNGKAWTPSTTVTSEDGYVLSKPGAGVTHPDYTSAYTNNVEVGTASVTLTARKYGIYVNMQEWRGNAAGSVTVNYEIRPDLPKNLVVSYNTDNMPVVTWDAAMTPGVTYVLYRSTDGETWNEYAATEATSYTIPEADAIDAYFRIGTRKVVSGKAYESVNRTATFTVAVVVSTGNNAQDGKPILTWKPVSGATMYEVYRSTERDGRYQKVFGGNIASYKHASAVEGETYYYYVKVTLADGTEIRSPIVENGYGVDWEDKVVRIYGQTRYETSLKIADAVKQEKNISKFTTVIIASGKNYADALAGSYLAYVKDAPILMASGSNDAELKAYIDANLVSGGQVYILGGKGAVPESLDAVLSGYNVKRLAGNTRFDTNIAILQEAGVTAGDEILVCTGFSFADSLAASAVGKPILLVDTINKKLTEGQKNYLATVDTDKFCIIGGTGAVDATGEALIQQYGSVERVFGANRYETSVAVAERFFDAPSKAVIAYALNYPDGLCGGPLAASMGAPLLLTLTDFQSAITEYTTANGIHSGAVLGGTGLIDNATVKDIFSVETIAEW